MDCSFELLSSMSPKVNKHTRPVRKAPSKLALKRNVRKSLNVLVFNNSFNNESIIIIESDSEIEASSENSNILNATPIVISDSDNSIHDKSGPSKASPKMPKTQKSKEIRLSNEKVGQIEKWIQNVNKNTQESHFPETCEFDKSANLDAFEKLQTEEKSDESNDIINDSQVKNDLSSDEEDINEEEPTVQRDDANSEVEVLLDSLYGKSWRANKYEILPSSEPQIKKTIKRKTPTTERRVGIKLNFDTSEKKNNLLETLQKVRIRRALESPWVEKLKNICDPDTESEENLSPEKPNCENKILTQVQPNFSDDKRDISVFSELSTVLGGNNNAGVNAAASSTLLSSGKRFDELFKKTKSDAKEKNKEIKNDEAGNSDRNKKNVSAKPRNKVPKSVPDNKKTTERRRKKEVLQKTEKNTNKSEESDSSCSDRRGLLPLRLNFDDDKENHGLNYKFKPETKTLSFLASLSGNAPADKSDYTALVFRKNFRQQRETLTKKLFKLYNEKVFDNLLKDVDVEWNSRMRCTAGICKCKKITRRTGAIERKAYIVLASKVLDAADRVRDTLIHEMCHAATWIVNEVSDGHGAFWKSWACRAMKVFPELPPISRCHNYVLNTKYTYRCTKCGYSVGRHSKSLDIERKRCGYCLGKFEVLINKVSKKGETKSVPSTPKKPSAFALFVKDNYTNYKSPGMAHADIMKALGQKFSDLKVENK